MSRRVLVFLVVLGGAAHAQPGGATLPDVPAPIAPAPTPPSDDAKPLTADRATCLRLDTTPGALLEPVQTGGGLVTPIPWTEFVVDGDLVDSAAAVHALLEP